MYKWAEIQNILSINIAITMWLVLGWFFTFNIGKRQKIDFQAGYITIGIVLSFAIGMSCEIWMISSKLGEWLLPNFAWWISWLCIGTTTYLIAILFGTLANTSVRKWLHIGILIHYCICSFIYWIYLRNVENRFIYIIPNNFYEFVFMFSLFFWGWVSFGETLRMCAIHYEQEGFLQRIQITKLTLLIDRGFFGLRALLTVVSFLFINNAVNELLYGLSVSVQIIAGIFLIILFLPNKLFFKFTYPISWLEKLLLFRDIRFLQLYLHQFYKPIIPRESEPLSFRELGELIYKPDLYLYPIVVDILDGIDLIKTDWEILTQRPQKQIFNQLKTVKHTDFRGLIIQYSQIGLRLRKSKKE